MIGRDEELRYLRGLLSEAATGNGGAVLVQGSVGVGKSTLLRTVGAEAAEGGFRVLRTSGVEAEQCLPFAALHLLLQPVARDVETLPPMHRLALSAAFGVGETEPELFRVGLAVLELLADVAERQPVLLLVDDLQWIDSCSRDVIRFVARRTSDFAALAVVAERTPSSASNRPGLNLDLHLGPLGPTAAAELLDAGAPGLPALLRKRILEQAAGHPLALIELPKAVKGTRAAMDDLPLTRRLEDAFAAGTDSASRACRTFLLALAAEPTAPLSGLLDVASRLCEAEVGAGALQEAVDGGLVTLVDRTPEFRHPLMRSAIYARAKVADRLAAHRALAGLMHDMPERRLAHLAAATLGPDEELANRLVCLADAAQAGGKMSAAVPALRHAADLVVDAQRRAGILVRAAELSSEISDHVTTQVLLDRIDMSMLGPVERARLLCLAGRAAFEPDAPHRRILDMVSAAADAFDANATDVAENVLWRAAARCLFQDGDAQVRARTAAELNRWEPDPDAPHVLMVRAYTAPYQLGADVIARFDALSPSHEDARSLYFLGSGAMAVGELNRATQYLAPTATAWQSQGRLGPLARCLALSWPRAYLGQLDQARTEAAEGLALAEETGDRIAWLNLKATAGLVAALRGETEAAARAVRELRAHDLFSGMPFAAVASLQTDGLLALLDGHPMEAYDLLARAFDPADPHHHSVRCWLVAPDLADAAVAGGTTAQAREVLAPLPLLARRLPSEMMVVAHAYTDAVLATDDAAEERYAAALATLPSHSALVRARLHLHHGRWLRRQRRNVDARNPLRLARDEFDRIGAQPWADIAREQLRAAGEFGGRRSANGSEHLSAQEMQIAEMAAQGLTNREIGQRLFISHRTVGAHLYRIFPRLGVTGRGKLAAALAALDDEHSAADLPDGVD
jgi:DNA-binding CsgD family transcriptional regulator